MTHRNIVRQTHGEPFQMGPLGVRQPLPAPGLDGVSPFLLLHHAGPQVHEGGKPRTRLNPHPHRGFEPVTFLFNGKLHHRDSLGNEGFLESGDVQWMTAGSGILHSEGPSEAFAREGGTLELIQLWVNLPREHKMTQPKYQDIKRTSMPVVEKDGFYFTLVAGELEGAEGPATTFTPVVASMAHFSGGASTVVNVPRNHHVLIYVLDGKLSSNGSIIDALHMAVLDQSSSSIELTALSDGRLLLLSGEPIQEPVSSYGPFVMNYPGEIKQAILDYEMGRMGVLES